MFGIGCDIIEIDRVTKAVQRNDRFKAMVFSPAEMEYCAGLRCGKMESYAAFFAAKEAFLKALGTGFRGGKLNEISVVHTPLGEPVLCVSGFYADKLKQLNIKGIKVTLSHNKNMAMAVIVLE